jgi:Zn-finger nucleic acid-binding protein
MKRITTEIFIEVEETVTFKTTEQPLARDDRERQIELIICPHCGNAILDSRAETIKLLEEEK